MPRIPAKLFGPQPLAAVTTVFAVGIIMPGMMIPTANTVVTAARGWGPKSLAGMRSTFASWVGLGCRSSFAIFRATFWRSHMRLCRLVRKSVATVTLDASEVKREYRYEPRYGEVGKPKSRCCAGPLVTYL